MAAVVALFTTYGAGDDDVIAHATADLNVSFLDSVEGDDLFAEGRIVRKARTAAFGTTEVRDAGDRLIALGRATFLIRREPVGIVLDIAAWNYPLLIAVNGVCRLWWRATVCC